MEEQAIKKDYVSWWVDKATEEFERFTEEERAALAYISCILDFIGLAEKRMLPEKWIKIIDFAKKLSAEYVGWVDRIPVTGAEVYKALIVEEADNRGLSAPLREYILSHFPPPGELLRRKEKESELQRH